MIWSFFIWSTWLTRWLNWPPWCPLTQFSTDLWHLAASKACAVIFLHDCRDLCISKIIPLWCNVMSAIKLAFLVGACWLTDLQRPVGRGTPCKKRLDKIRLASWTVLRFHWLHLLYFVPICFQSKSVGLSEVLWKLLCWPATVCTDVSRGS